MTTIASVKASSQTWEFAFEGLQKITPAKGLFGQDQLVITLSTAKKADELVSMCGLHELNRTYSHFGFSSGGTLENNQVVLWGPGDHEKLLDVLKGSITPNTTKVFQYTLIK